MSISVAGAILLMASNLAGVSNTAEFTAYEASAEKSGLASKIVTTFLGVAATAAVYRHTDSDLEYYPLEARFSTEGVKLRNPLSMERNGLRLQLSPISQGRLQGPGLSRDFKNQSRKMSHIMPGYPQPARVVIGVKVSY